MIEDAGKRKSDNQSLNDRLREIKSEEGWVDTSDPDWKARLSERMNKKSKDDEI